MCHIIHRYPKHHDPFVYSLSLALCALFNQLNFTNFGRFPFATAWHNLCHPRPSRVIPPGQTNTSRQFRHQPFVQKVAKCITSQKYFYNSSLRKYINRMKVPLYVVQRLISRNIISFRILVLFLYWDFLFSFGYCINNIYE